MGQFNDVVADYAVETLASLPGKSQVWAVGERVHARLADAGLPLMGVFSVPNSVKAITPLVGQIIVESETRRSPSTMLKTGQGIVTELYLFYNRLTSGAVYEPISQRLLPLDETWRRMLTERPWPTKSLPEVMGSGADNLAGAHPRISIRSRSFEHVPNCSPARTQAVWRQCNVPTKISTNCWMISTGHSIACARVASTKNSSMSSPASKR